MEEKQFFEEMKPLLKDYVEFTKEDMSEKWEDMEKEALAKVEESQARLDEAKEKHDEAKNKDHIFKTIMPQVQVLGGQTYKAVEDDRNANLDMLKKYAREYNQREKELVQANEEVEQTKAKIEEEKQERVEKQQEKQENVYAKAKEYIDLTKEQMRENVEEKSHQLEEMTKQRRELAAEAKIASDLTLTIKRSTNEVKSSETYKVLSEKAEEELQSRKAMYKAYNKEVMLAKEELEGAEATLASFEAKYDAIDFASEAGIQSLIEITGWEEESVITEEQSNDTQELVTEEEIHKITEDEAEIVEDNKTKRELSTEEIDEILSDKDIEEIDETQEDQQELTEYQKWDEIEAIFKGIEEGFEDLRTDRYLLNKIETLGMEDVDEAMKRVLPVKGMSLLEIYQDEYDSLDPDSMRARLLSIDIENVKNRASELENASIEEKRNIKHMAQEYAKEDLKRVAEHIWEEQREGFEDLLGEQYWKRIEMLIEDINNISDINVIERKLARHSTMTLSGFLSESIVNVSILGTEEDVKALEEMAERVTAKEEADREILETAKQEETPVEETEEEQQELTEEQKWDEIRAIFKGIEEGFEDLRSVEYLKVKYRIFAMQDVDLAMKSVSELKGKTLLEIYEGMLKNIDEKHPHYKELEQLVGKVKEREEELQQTESNENGLSLSEIAFMAAQMGGEKCLINALESMYLDDIEGNFKDLLIPEYISMREKELNGTKKCTIAQIEEKIIAMCGKTLKDIYKEQLRVAKQEQDAEKIKKLEAIIRKVEKREKDLKLSKQEPKQQPKQQPKSEQQPKPEQQPKSTGGNQILQSGQGQPTKLPISKIEVDSNKGKMTVYYSDGIEADPVEYDIKEVLGEKEDTLWGIERIKNDDHSFRTREILKEMTSKQRKAILKSANIFVLKALLEYERRNDPIKGSKMIEAYLNNIDIANNITKSSDEEQMPLPKIIHNLMGRTISKGDYKKVVQYANKDQGLDGVTISDAMIKVPKTLKEKFATLFGRTPQEKARKAKAKQEKIRRREEKLDIKSQKAEEKEMAKERRKRERGIEKDIAKRERQEVRERLGMQHYEINHEEARKKAEEEFEKLYDGEKTFEEVFGENR